MSGPYCVLVCKDSLIYLTEVLCEFESLTNSYLSIPIDGPKAIWKSRTFASEQSLFEVHKNLGLESEIFAFILFIEMKISNCANSIEWCKVSNKKVMLNESVFDLIWSFVVLWHKSTKYKSSDGRSGWYHYRSSSMIKQRVDVLVKEGCECTKNTYPQVLSREIKSFSVNVK